MEIVFPESEKFCTFGDLSPGSVFSIQQSVCMKTSHTAGSNANAVDLETGVTKYISIDGMVTLFSSARIVLKGGEDA